MNLFAFSHDAQSRRLIWHCRRGNGRRGLRVLNLLYRLDLFAMKKVDGRFNCTSFSFSFGT